MTRSRLLLLAHELAAQEWPAKHVAVKGRVAAECWRLPLCSGTLPARFHLLVQARHARLVSQPAAEVVCCFL